MVTGSDPSATDPSARRIDVTGGIERPLQGARLQSGWPQACVRRRGPRRGVSATREEYEEETHSGKTMIAHGFDRSGWSRSMMPHWSSADRDRMLVCASRLQACPSAVS